MTDLVEAYRARHQGHTAGGRAVAEEVNALPDDAYRQAYNDAYLAKYGQKPPETLATPSTAEPEKNTAGRLAGSAGEGVARSVWELGRTVREAADFITTNPLTGYGEEMARAGLSPEEVAAGRAEFTEVGAMPDMVRDKSGLESFTSGVAQFMAPFAAFSKAMAGARVFDAVGKSKVGASLLKGAAASAPVDFAFIDPIENNLVDIARRFGFESELTNYLGANTEDDSALTTLENRIKAAVVNAPLGVAAEVGIPAAVKGMALAAKGIKAVRNYAGEIGPIGPVAQRGQIGVAARSAQQRALEIPRGENLSTVERDVETRFATKVSTQYDEAKREYAALEDTQGGKFLSVDDARDLSPDYNASKDTRGEFAVAVHEPASWFIKQLYAEKLATLKEGEQVMFLSGGTGAGKTTALTNVPSVSVAADDAKIVYDSNFQSVGKATQKIEQALRAGGTAHIVHVIRDPVEALVNGALPRMVRQGRAVPLKAHAETHIGSAKTIVALAEKYKDNPKVKITVIDNRNGKGKAARSTLRAVAEIDYTDLVSRLEAEANKALDEGRISGKQYRAIMGRNNP